MTANEVIAILLKRVAKFPTQRAAADALDISPAYLSDILSGRREPGPAVLKALGIQKAYEKLR